MPFFNNNPWTRMQSHETRKENKRKETEAFDYMVYASKIDGQDPKRHRLCPVVRIVLMPQSMNA